MKLVWIAQKVEGQPVLHSKPLPQKKERRGKERGGEGRTNMPLSTQMQSHSGLLHPRQCGILMKKQPQLKQPQNVKTTNKNLKNA